jgi:hypothetical protein
LTIQALKRDPAIFLDAVFRLNYTHAGLARTSRNRPEPSNKENFDAPGKGNNMAKISFTLKSVTKEIEKAEKKLRAIRSKVTKADQKKIDLNLRSLKRGHGIIAHICRPPTMYGQSFTTKPNK